MSDQERDAYVQKLIGEKLLVEDSQRAKIRAAACQKVGWLLSRRYPFVWP